MRRTRRLYLLLLAVLLLIALLGGGLFLASGTGSILVRDGDRRVVVTRQAPWPPYGHCADHQIGIEPGVTLCLEYDLVFFPCSGNTWSFTLQHIGNQPWHTEGWVIAGIHLEPATIAPGEILWFQSEGSRPRWLRAVMGTKPPSSGEGWSLPVDVVGPADAPWTYTLPRCSGPSLN